MDRYDNISKDLSQPAVDGVVVTPGTSALTDVTRALWVGGGGDIEVTFLGIDNNPGATLVITGVPSGQLLPVRVTHVLAGGTTATGIIALI